MIARAVVRGRPGVLDVLDVLALLDKKDSEVSMAAGVALRDLAARYGDGGWRIALTAHLTEHDTLATCGLARPHEV